MNALSIDLSSLIGLYFHNNIIYGLIMTDEKTPTDLSIWLSTYGTLTANRILERFNIYLDSDELVSAIKDPLSIYHQLLIVPLKNVFNGIILQQAQSYQVYAQKLFIDYLLTGESGKEETSPGANTRDDLEQERIKLVTLDEDFQNLVFTHQQLISESQLALIKASKRLINTLKKASVGVSQILKGNNLSKEEHIIQKAIRTGMIHHASINQDVLAVNSSFWMEMAAVLTFSLDDQLREKLAAVLIVLDDPRHEVEEALSIYKERSVDMGINLRSYRRQFYDIILRGTELLNFLPDYRVNTEQVVLNRAEIHFDPNLGGN